MSCDHDNWRCVEKCTLGFGFCFDCDTEIPLAQLFDRLRERAQKMIDETKTDVPREIIELAKHLNDRMLAHWQTRDDIHGPTGAGFKNKDLQKLYDALYPIARLWKH